jgi:hypothetical protein
MPRGGSKPGGPQSQNLTPRIGRGAGYGGPARGAATDRAETIQTRAPFAGAQDAVRTPWGQRKAEIAAKAIGLFEAVLDDPDEVALNRMTAADKLLDRVIGKPKQTVENMGETTMIIKTGVPRAGRD